LLVARNELTRHRSRRVFLAVISVANAIQLQPRFAAHFSTTFQPIAGHPSHIQSKIASS
jgi:hypothetical protein